MERSDADVIVVGSGFGGSVTALRLTEKGYRVLVLEAGRRWQPHARFPATNWDLRDFLWLPELGLRGMQRLTLLNDVLVLSMAGVGGGSLLYACTLYRPAEAFYRDRHWSDITDWERELAPYFDQAERMLGSADTPFETPADRVLRDVADDLGVTGTYRPTPVGIWFGSPGVTVPDPYFGGAGPERTGCIACGACMVGCRHGAKNTLDRNYLWLAERGGAVIRPEHQVVDLRPLPDGGYEVATDRPGPRRGRRLRTFRAPQVVLSAGVLGTLKLLFALRDRGRLPDLPPALGELLRTNSEAIVGVTARSDEVDYAYGNAITSSIHPDADTHIEPVRYPKGSNAMGTLSTIMVDGGGQVTRRRRFLEQIARDPLTFLRSLSVRRWAERTVILLVMQSLDNSLTVRRRRTLLGDRLVTEQGHGVPNPTYLPIAHRVARLASQRMGGDPRGAWTEALLDVPTTAHIIGGAVIAESPTDGVVDPWHRVQGHPGLHIADGSVISANLGVNPSLTITAMAERAMAHWPNAGEPDPRPALGQPYRPVPPVPPERPAVPDHAPAALRLPVTGS